MNRFFSMTALLVVLATTTTTTVDAFTTNNAFVGRPLMIPTRIASSKTALSMNLFDRFTRVVKGNVNEVLKNLEDPEKIMNQAIEDMQGDLVKVRQSYAEITATQRRLLKQKEQADAMADDWYNRAQLALKAGNEELAKEALTRRQTQADEAAALQSQIDSQNEAIDKLYEGMQVLEKKILESKSKKETMVARARTAQSTQKVNDMLSGISGKTSMDAFNRMEEKVEALEASAEVSAEMGSMSGGAALPGSAASSLENEFKLLESKSAVDDELSKMKQNLLSDSSSSSSSGSSSSSSKSSGDPKIDDELEKLKRDAGM